MGTKGRSVLGPRRKCQAQKTSRTHVQFGSMHQQRRRGRGRLQKARRKAKTLPKKTSESETNLQSRRMHQPSCQWRSVCSTWGNYTKMQSRRMHQHRHPGRIVCSTWGRAQTLQSRRMHQICQKRRSLHQAWGKDNSKNLQSRRMHQIFPERRPNLLQAWEGVREKAWCVGGRSRMLHCWILFEFGLR